MENRILACPYFFGLKDNLLLVFEKNPTRLEEQFELTLS